MAHPEIKYKKGDMEVFIPDADLKGVRYRGKEYLRGFGGYELVRPLGSSQDYEHISYKRIPKKVRDILWPGSGALE